MENKQLFWDRVAGVYDVFVHVINAKTHKALQKEVASLICPFDSVLECACGTGLLTKVIAPRCRKLIATDFSKKMVQKTKAKCRNYSNVYYMVADMNKLNFQDGVFDKVIAGNVIHLLDNPYHALQELDRICVPGGQIIVPTYMNKPSNNWKNKLIKLYGKMGAGFKQKFTFSTYQKFIRDAGHPEAQFIRVDGFIPCSIAVIEKK
jgi:phosphatidylethanolamine/phosphatidyl-N-methylethanolamine N-methyltransferase